MSSDETNVLEVALVLRGLAMRQKGRLIQNEVEIFIFGFFLFGIYLAKRPGRDAAIRHIICRGRNQSLHHARCCCAVGASGEGSINSRLNSII